MFDDLKKRLESRSIEELYSDYCPPMDSLVSPIIANDVHITSLTIYPVKGCMAFPVTEWPMHEAGLYLDRHWCIKSMTTGKCLNIVKQMDTIIIHPFVDLVNKILILATPGMDKNFLLPIKDNEFQMSEDAQLHSIVMYKVNLGSTFEDCGDEVACWINEALHMSDCRLLRQVQLRSNNLSMASDSHIQIMNISSLHDLQEGVAEEQGFMTTSLSELCLRFRPNIVVGGLKKYEEKRLDDISIRGIKLKGGDLVERCKAVNLDLQRYDYESYPLKYLLKAGNGRAYFGLHTFVTNCNDNEIIRVGDTITIHSYKD